MIGISSRHSIQRILDFQGQFMYFLAEVRRTCISITLILLFCLVQPTSLAESPNSAVSIIRDYSTMLSKIEEQFKHCYGEGVFMSFSKTKEGDIKPRSSAKVGFAFSGINGMVSQTAIDFVPLNPEAGKIKENQVSTRDYQAIVFHNKNYSCKLTRKSAESELLVNWLSTDPAAGQKDISRGPGHFARFCSQAGLFPLSSLFAIAGFKIEKTEELEKSHPNMRIKIRFSIPERVVKSPATTQVVSGWLVISPANSWKLLDYGLAFSARGKIVTTRVGHVDYVDRLSGGLLPASVKESLYLGDYDPDSIVDPPSEIPLIEEFRFTKFSFGDTADRAFTLSGFGLPEFGQTVTQASTSRSYPWWILGSAIGLAILALTLRRVSKRTPTAA